MKVLIAGCGYVGEKAGVFLTDAGCQVWGLRRDIGHLPAGIRSLSADLRRPETLVHLPKNLNCVIYAAGPETSEVTSYKETFIHGLENLLASPSLRSHPPGRLIFVSSTRVFGQRNGEWVDETSAANPVDERGRIILHGEEIARGSQIPSIVLRLGGIYGRGRDRLFQRVLRGDLDLKKPANRYTNRIHRDDCAGVLLHLVILDKPQPLYLGVDHEPAELRTVTDWLKARLRRPPADFNPLEPPAGPSKIGKRCKNLRLIQSGYRFRFPTFREGYESLLEEWGEKQPD